MLVTVGLEELRLLVHLLFDAGHAAHGHAASVALPGSRTKGWRRLSSRMRTCLGVGRRRS
jgi:hypothetical protein